MEHKLLSKIKNMDFSLRNQVISWLMYSVVLLAVVLSNRGAYNPATSNMNCFQDEFITFALYLLYYLPNKNILHDNLYIYPRLISPKKVCIYYFKIYIKSSLIYFFGINVINSNFPHAKPL